MLFLASQKQRWNLTLNTIEGEHAARTDDFLVEAVCPSMEIAEEVRRFLIAHQLIHKVQIVTLQLPTPEDAGLSSNHIFYDGSDERGVGTGNE